MANEITVTGQLVISSGQIDYASRPTSFRADMDGAKGPSPGAVSVGAMGTQIDLSELAHPGMCRMQNLDDTYTIHVGIYDSDSDRFFPMIELKPGENYIFRLSSYLSRDLSTGTSGTGTLGAANQLWARCDGGVADLLVEAFES